MIKSPSRTRVLEFGPEYIGGAPHGVIWGDARGCTRGVAPAVRGVRAVGGVRALTAMVSEKKNRRSAGVFW